MKHLKNKNIQKVVYLKPIIQIVRLDKTLFYRKYPWYFDPTLLALDSDPIY